MKSNSINSNIRILMFLIGNKEKKFTIKQISENTKINYRIAYEQIMKLEKEELVKVTPIGNSKMCEFTNTFNSHVYEAEYQRKEDLFKNKDFRVIHNQLSELNFPFILLLFGSYAKGTQTKNSDIDLLLISKDEEEKIINNKLNLLPHNIHLTQVTYEAFIRMIKSKDFSVVSEAIKNNIILIGVEDYYKLLKNAR